MDLIDPPRRDASPRHRARGCQTVLGHFMGDSYPATAHLVPDLAASAAESNDKDPWRGFDSAPLAPGSCRGPPRLAYGGLTGRWYSKARGIRVPQDSTYPLTDRWARQRRASRRCKEDASHGKHHDQAEASARREEAGDGNWGRCIDCTSVQS